MAALPDQQWSYINNVVIAVWYSDYLKKISQTQNCVKNCVNRSAYVHVFTFYLMYFLVYETAEKLSPLTSHQLVKFDGTVCEAVNPPAASDYSDND